MTYLPYSASKAGAGREKEIHECLRGVGAGAVGFMVDDEARTVMCQFRLSGRQITVPVSVAAYEAAWLKANPRGPRADAKTHAARARTQAEIAVWAILADWIKANVAMMLGGLADADTAFLSHIHAPDGRRVVEVIADRGQGLLPPPHTGKEEDTP